MEIIFSLDTSYIDMADVRFNSKLAKVILNYSW
jgi:hypothetical protein